VTDSETKTELAVCASQCEQETKYVNLLMHKINVNAKTMQWRHFSKSLGVSVILGGLSLCNVLFLQQ